MLAPAHRREALYVVIFTPFSTTMGQSPWMTPPRSLVPISGQKKLTRSPQHLNQGLFCADPGRDANIARVHHAVPRPYKQELGALTLVESTPCPTPTSLEAATPQVASKRSRYGSSQGRVKAMSDSARAKHATALLLGVSVLMFGTPPSDASPQDASGKPAIGDWVYVDHDLAGTRYSHLKQITTKNVSQLVKACAYSFPDKEPSQTAPIVSAGTMYLTTAHYTVALDGADCHVIWSSTWTPRGHEPTNTHRGAALADGKVIRGTDDGFLLALDAKDGHTLWAKQIADPKEGEFISMAPLVHGHLIYIGPAGSETAAKGW